MQKFKRRRALNLVSTLIIFGAAFFAFWFSNNRASIPDEGTRSLIVLGICTVSLGALGFSIYNWRCPSCGKHLGGTVDPRRCRKCGYQFK